MSINPCKIVEMGNVSVFRSFAQLVENKALIEIITEIQSGKYQKEVENIRLFISSNKTEAADKLKKQLLGFTPSGTFDNGRKIELLTTYSGYIVLDLDKLNPTQLHEAKLKATQIVYTYAAFISPSGKGLKIIIPVNATASQHKAAYQQVADYYQQELNQTIDPSGKDVSRLCFMSYDPECFINQIAKPFNLSSENAIQKELKIKSNNTQKLTTDTLTAYKKCVEFTEQIQTYGEGFRNRFIYLLACNCNRAGLPQSAIENHIINDYDLSRKETLTSIDSAYKNNASEFGTFANIANSAKDYPAKTPAKTNDFANSANFASQTFEIMQPSEITQADSKYYQLLNMPLIPAEIFDSLPEILKNGCAVFTDDRERDVFLTGAITIMSGCMFNVSGLYNGKQHYANLYSFIIAGAASGKGAMVWAKELGIKVHKKLLSISETQKKVYEAEMQNYKKQLYDKKVKSAEMEMPVEPPFKLLFIPANNSSARVIQHLKEGGEQGIFCETEADSMGNVLKQDWGGYSDLIRKAFHHEPISYSRKTNKEYVELNHPCFAIALSGTPGQVENLIKSSEDGLFSRFIFYTFKSLLAWRKASEKHNGVNLTEHFDHLSNETLRFVEFLETVKKINFNLTQSQWDALNSFGENSLLNLSCLYSDDLSSTSKRLGLILFRHCMVLTALRYFDSGEIPVSIQCSDVDFEIAIKLVKVYEQHAVFMFNELPKSTTGADKALKKFFDLLPDKFQRKEAIELALIKLQIKERTADGYLSKLLTNKLLDNPRSGQYEKIKK